MAFVRVKNIKGNRYAYLVENTWKRKGSRQSVKSYLGKVLEPDQKDISEEPPEIEDLDYKTAVLELVSWTLRQHGFDKDGHQHEKDQTSVDLKEKCVSYKDRNAVLKLNEGFLCDHTLLRALTFSGEGSQAHEVGKRLASTLLEAGLKVPEEHFVKLFQKAYTPPPGGEEVQRV